MTVAGMGVRRCLLEPLRPPALVLDPFVRIPLSPSLGHPLIVIPFRQRRPPFFLIGGLSVGTLRGIGRVKDPSEEAERLKLT